VSTINSFPVTHNFILQLFHHALIRLILAAHAFMQLATAELVACLPMTQDMLTSFLPFGDHFCFLFLAFVLFSFFFVLSHLRTKGVQWD
jgi:hypothetical protein